MDVKQITQNAFLVAGISTRTINKDGQAGQDIGDLWSKFMQQNILLQIPNRLSDDIYCLYTDYETDYTGFYTAVLGCKVQSFEDVPVSLTMIKIPSGKYSVYTLPGKSPKNVETAWQEIWNSDIERKYTTDFDIYNKEENYIYVAVRG